MIGFVEIREADAPPATAAIYAEIRKASGLPLVNLIWRHFAAMPGVLPWAWAAVAPLVRATAMEEARGRVTAGIVLPASDTFDWQEAGLGGGDIARITAILDAYTRGNLTNLLALTALRLRLERPAVRSCALLLASVLPPAPPTLDRLPSIASLPPEVAAQVRVLAARHGGPADIIPSLYLHLAHWPRLLELLPRGLAGLYAPGVLEAVRDATRSLAEEEAALLLPVLAQPPAGMEAVIEAALGHFTKRIIPDLLPVCLALRRSTGAGSKPL